MGRHPLLRYIHLRWRFTLILIRMNINAIIDCRLNTMRSLATYMQMLQSYYPHSFHCIVRRGGNAFFSFQCIIRTPLTKCTRPRSASDPAPQCKKCECIRFQSKQRMRITLGRPQEATGGHRRPQEATGQFGCNGSWENAFFCDGFKPPLKKKHVGWISSICAAPPRQSVAPNLKFKPLLLV